MKRKYRYFAGDFETTVYDGQETTEVWASACTELYTEKVYVFHSIEEQFNFFVSLDCNLICYYHNLRFDGNFWIYFLLAKLKYAQAMYQDDLEDINTTHFYKNSEMINKSFKYSISSLGQWYSITIKVNDHFIEFRDSLKLMPFTLAEISESFGTKHKKLDMEYKGKRYSGCEISDKEMEYIKNDVLVLKEALEFMFHEGHDKLTIGSCCLSEFRRYYDNAIYDKLFPNLYEIPIDENIFGSKTAGDYVKRSYRGGWCYVKRGAERKVYHNGITLDVNSLYPSMMSSESGNYYPIGKPTFWVGDKIPKNENYRYIIRIKTRFYLKKWKLPFIQIKGDPLYFSTKMLETSDIELGGTYYKYYEKNGETLPARVTLTLTDIDYKLFLEHYNVKDFEILDGCYFSQDIGLFDRYINKYKKQKQNSKGAKRTEAKLFLNNLYGKMASSPQSNFNVAYLKDTGEIGYYTVIASDKKPGYIPAGTFITSYARNFTIRAAQKNYKHFLYADTDSLHMNCNIADVKGLKIDSKEFCCWAHESSWDYGRFIRAKTYIEHVTESDGVSCETFYNLKCAGLPDKCKDLFLASCGLQKIVTEKLSNQELEFLRNPHKLSDFDIGLCIPGKLMPKRIPGGVILVDGEYKIRKT